MDKDGKENKSIRPDRSAGIDEIGDMTETNVRILEAYLRDGCKIHCIQKLGVEIEHIIVQRATGEAITYAQEHGVREILEELSEYYPDRMEEDGHILGLSNLDYTITLEPAAQIEISIAPKESIAVIEKVYESFRKILLPILESYDYELVTLGYQPKSHVDDLPMIPKKRYRYMDDYFKTSGTRGRNMMRGTASTQISIDYCCEQDFIRKYRTVSILMPALKLLSDNTPVFEGAPYKGYLARTEIWNHVDPKRCGILDGIFSEEFGFATYARYLWELPPIFVPVEGGSMPTGQQRVCDLWKYRKISKKDLDHILSMTFVDVRVKHYIEIRGADSMPKPYVMAYLALIKGIFFDPAVQTQILEKYPVGKAEILAAEQSLLEAGYDGTIYGLPADTFTKEMLELAMQNLDEQEKKYLEPYMELCRNRETLSRQENSKETW